MPVAIGWPFVVFGSESEGRMSNLDVMKRHEETFRKVSSGRDMMVRAEGSEKVSGRLQCSFFLPKSMQRSSTS